MPPQLTTVMRHLHQRRPASAGPGWVGSRGAITHSPSPLDPDVRLSPHPAPDVLDFRLAHVDVVVAAFVHR
jgi:hypothetical protein